MKSLNFFLHDVVQYHRHDTEIEFKPSYEYRLGMKTVKLSAGMNPTCATFDDCSDKDTVGHLGKEGWYIVTIFCRHGPTTVKVLWRTWENIWIYGQLHMPFIMAQDEANIKQPEAINRRKVQNLPSDLVLKN